MTPEELAAFEAERKRCAEALRTLKWKQP